jgi:hypothetical protein
VINEEEVFRIALDYKSSLNPIQKGHPGLTSQDTDTGSNREKQHPGQTLSMRQSTSCIGSGNSSACLDAASIFSFKSLYARNFCQLPQGCSCMTVYQPGFWRA